MRYVISDTLDEAAKDGNPSAIFVESMGGNPETRHYIGGTLETPRFVSEQGEAIFFDTKAEAQKALKGFLASEFNGRDPVDRTWDILEVQ